MPQEQQQVAPLGGGNTMPSDVHGQAAVHVKGCRAGAGPPGSAYASHSSLINGGLASKVTQRWEEREVAHLCSLW